MYLGNYFTNVLDEIYNKTNTKYNVHKVFGEGVIYPFRNSSYYLEFDEFKNLDSNLDNIVDNSNNNNNSSILTDIIKQVIISLKNNKNMDHIRSCPDWFCYTWIIYN